ncbi:hypothetical protein EVAR_14695_1 [Eumeta japonica]|uniref:Uncharacterized protein n=1 Tax=Eumeta variegata TaxID=151549 RepID=A0A4C1U3P3_EUMVA|nr:hypothetical protein EVAR_14695_1 [Eumeta japonica]
MSARGSKVGRQVVPTNFLRGRYYHLQVVLPPFHRCFDQNAESVPVAPTSSYMFSNFVFMTSALTAMPEYYIAIIIDLLRGVGHPSVHGRGVVHPAYISQNTSWKSGQFECSGRRNNPKKRGSSPLKRVKPVASVVQRRERFIQNHSRRRISVLHNYKKYLYS